MANRKLTRNLLSATIAESINQQIIQQEMAPGTKLPSETQLADDYRVSRPTIREAMKILKAQNIVLIRQGDGTYVSARPGLTEDPLGLRFIQQEALAEGVFEARLLIEPQIAMLAAERATEAELREMGEVVEELLHTDYKSSARSSLDIQFHTMIAQFSKNPVFNHLMPAILETIEKGFIILYESQESHRRAQQMHKEIYEAFVRRDVVRAKCATESHIYSSLLDIQKLERGGTL